MSSGIRNLLQSASLSQSLRQWLIPAALSTANCTESGVAQGSATSGTARGSKMHWGTILACFTAGVAVSSAASCDTTAEPNDNTCSKDKKRLYFKYEKRLRDFSTHEKMFEYFSSGTQEGRKCMSASDVLRAVLAVYPPDSASWVRSGSLAGENAPKVDHAMSKEAVKFLSDFDIDGDGSFSFDEFILFLVLLSMPLKDMQAIFTVMDTDGNGTLDKQEFMDVVQSLMRYAGKASHSKLCRSGSFGPSSPGREEEPFIHQWFGKDGSGRLRVTEFARFLISLHGIFDGLEFNLLDGDHDGLISGIDLGRSFVSPASVEFIDRLLDRAEALPPELRDAKIDRSTFMATQQFVRKFHRVHVPLTFWQDTGHTCDVAATQRLVRHACKTEIPEVVIRIFFHVFKDANGQLDSKAMHSAMYSKYQHINFSTTQSPGILKCLLDCVNPVQP